jgi:superfamily I DNA/RNA helicase
VTVWYYRWYSKSREILELLRETLSLGRVRSRGSRRWGGVVNVARVDMLKGQELPDVFLSISSLNFVQTFCSDLEGYCRAECI